MHERLLPGAEAEAAFVDSTHCKVHQHANGATDRAGEAAGTSRGGLNTKVHAACDALLRLCTPMVLTPGFRRVATRYEKTKRMFLAMLVFSVSATYEQFGLWNPM